MKKIICTLLALLILFSFCSCMENGITNEITDFIMSEFHIDWENFSAEKPTERGSAYKIYFDSLSLNQKKAYNNIFNEVLDAEEQFPDKIEVPLMEGEELSQVYEAVIYDNPEIMCFGGGASILTEGNFCFFKPEYTMTPEDMRTKTELLSEFADEICFGFTEDMSDFDRELYIHDFIVKNCTYDCDKDDAGLAYTCLSSGYASCEGYAKATKYLLEKAGIECYNILGDAVNLQNVTESHMWNLVKINGNFYYLDTTWDDPSESSSIVSHAYFNLTENEIRTDHSNFKILQPCESTEENYFTKTGNLFYSADYYSRLKMEDAFVSVLLKNESSVELRFADDNAYFNGISILIDEGKAYDIQQNIKYNHPELNMSDEIKYSKNEKFRIIELIF